ncbi:hypothetical protein HNR12_005261 [Streptomonospora nanhaiensis]|uniref:Hemerythrin-like domain-containing protein n=1 Tax=Streptomonospora nanhaiensis TaxID=1323731 RepID=A0A853BVE2_9ACTN|nr:hemerythrin domain-containing protein [Streptomonospora nanhaiensis]NYI98984.1 hypothetical protein [Streptomonospora nanhaiensis]
MSESQTAPNPLLDELKWVHGMLRRDLAACRRLAADAARGAPAGEIREGLSRLRSQGPLFQLRTNCLAFCRFVHHHHGLEDAAVFPRVRRTAPHLAAAVDRLEADHRVVSDLLDEVEAAAGDLTGDAAAQARARLAAALDTLADHLLEHLDYEEDVLGPVFLTW